MQLRRLWLRLALGLLLVFAQQQATLHALQHGVESLARKQAPASPQQDVCVQCVFFGALHDAPPSTALQAVASPAGHVLAPVRAASWVAAAPFAHYRSRAPPRFS